MSAGPLALRCKPRAAVFVPTLRKFALADRILVIDDGRVALDLAVDAERPRRRGNPSLAKLEGTIIERLLGDARLPVVDG